MTTIPANRRLEIARAWGEGFLEDLETFVAGKTVVTVSVARSLHTGIITAIDKHSIKLVSGNDSVTTTLRIRREAIDSICEVQRAEQPAPARSGRRARQTPEEITVENVDVEETFGSVIEIDEHPAHLEENEAAAASLTTTVDPDDPDAILAEETPDETATQDDEIEELPAESLISDETTAPEQR